MVYQTSSFFFLLLFLHLTLFFQDDPNLENYNLNTTAAFFAAQMNARAAAYATENVLVTWGSDFLFMNAYVEFKNMDKLIAYMNANQDKYRMKSSFFFFFFFFFILLLIITFVIFPMYRDASSVQYSFDLFGGGKCGDSLDHSGVAFED
jgi:hypothetical protein